MNHTFQHNITMWSMAAAVMLLAACTDDTFEVMGGNPEFGEQSEAISFGVKWEDEAATRSAQHEGVDDLSWRNGTKIVLRNDSNQRDTVCLNATIEIADGIDAGNRTTTIADLEGAATRGVAMNPASDFYHTKMGVTAYLTYENSTTVVYMDNVAVEKIAGTENWASTDKYYWLGTGTSYQFYAYAPNNATIEASFSKENGNKFTYTVPTDVMAQQDVVATKTDPMAGDWNKTVPLTYTHTCAAVKFKVGTGMQAAGSIKSIALLGVKNSGTYDFDSKTWTLNNTTDNYVLTMDKAIDNSMAGDAITDDDQTFLLLPQSFTESAAALQVIFYDNATGHERNLTASLNGQTWAMGTTTTYNLSIDKDFGLQFESEYGTYQDAHYVIYPITFSTIIPSGQSRLNWTVAVEDPTNNKWVKLRSELDDMGKRGYWISDEGYNNTTYPLPSNIDFDDISHDTERATSISGTANSDGTVTVYAYLRENATDSLRSTKLLLYQTDGEKDANGNPKNVDEFVLPQLPPSWNDTIGVERIEEDECKSVPWGYNYARVVEYTYDADSIYADVPIGGSFLAWIAAGARSLILYFSYEVNLPQNGFYTKTNSGIAVTVTLDYNVLSNISTTTNDGLTNTKNIYGVTGNLDVAEVENFLKTFKGLSNNAFRLTSEKGGDVELGNSAVAKALKKNIYYKRTATGSQGGESETNVVPYIHPGQITWYLPAKGEMTKPLSDGDKYYSNPLNGNYWTSTGGTSDEDAVMYTPTSSVADKPRSDLYTVRAVRKKP